MLNFANMQRAFYYGDLLFESILIENNEIKLVERHFNRLVKSAGILGFQLEDDFSLTIFIKQIENAIAASSLKNKNTCRVRYTIYRTGDGFYLPTNNQCHFMIDTFDINREENESKIHKVGVYRENHKACTSLSNLKTGNALLYVMASVWAKNNKLDDALIMNEHGRLIESTSANIFWIKEGVTYTPPLSEGCIAGVMREEIMNKEMLIEKPCNEIDLLDADEIFLTNAIWGKKYISLANR